MSIKTGYLAKSKEYPENENKILVMKNRGNDELAPPEELLDSWKNDEISWNDYEVRYREYISGNNESLSRIRELAEQSQRGKNIRLICYENPDKHCHRHILKKIIEERIEEMPHPGDRLKVNLSNAGYGELLTYEDLFRWGSNG